MTTGRINQIANLKGNTTHNFLFAKKTMGRVENTPYHKRRKKNPLQTPCSKKKYYMEGTSVFFLKHCDKIHAGACLFCHFHTNSAGRQNVIESHFICTCIVILGPATILCFLSETHEKSGAFKN